MDWNQDGKIDYKDHAFYNNVVEPGTKNIFSTNTGSSHQNKKNSIRNSQGISESGGKGWAVFIGICVFYLFFKLIGG